MEKYRNLLVAEGEPDYPMIKTLKIFLSG